MTTPVPILDVHDIFHRRIADFARYGRVPDKTITRVGANTVFSFEGKDRSVNLESGSLLFHSPKGKGGGTIKSGGASAAVLGTTLIVSSVAGGGFKVVLLEGTEPTETAKVPDATEVPSGEPPSGAPTGDAPIPSGSQAPKPEGPSARTDTL